MEQLRTQNHQRQTPQCLEVSHASPVARSQRKAIAASYANENGIGNTHANHDRITQATTANGQSKCVTQQWCVGSVDRLHAVTILGLPTMSSQATHNPHWLQHIDHATVAEAIVGDTMHTRHTTPTPSPHHTRQRTAQHCETISESDQLLRHRTTYWYKGETERKRQKPHSPTQSPQGKHCVSVRLEPLTGVTVRPIEKLQNSTVKPNSHKGETAPVTFFLSPWL
jgi:hypothetical protein